MTNPRRIYLLSPKDLSPETIAVTFAKTSRSPQPFDAIAAELTDERSAQFHEKWVVGYGHSSVAEHAVLHLALENVSRLAIETIEGNRLASYTEKSTRYQQWEGDAFFVPEELADHPLREPFVATCQTLFQTYQRCVAVVQQHFQSTISQEEGESPKAYARRIHPMAVDVCRFLLPAASLANVGVTINARALEYAMCKMLSSPLVEVREIGESLLAVAQKETPTLIKYAQCNRYLQVVRDEIRGAAQDIPTVPGGDSVRLVAWDKDGQAAILAAVLYRFGASGSYEACLNYVTGLSQEELRTLVQSLMGERGKFDQPLREFEYAQMTFDVVMDQGAYFEFKRHRMMTQTPQPLRTHLGFAIPRAITDSGCEADYRAAMEQAAALFAQMEAWNPDVASYVVPNGFNRRVLFTMNLREAFAFCRLRAAENAHFSIRWVAYRIAEIIQEIYPLLGSFLEISQDCSSSKIQEQYLSSL